MDSTFLTDDYPGETAPIDQETQPQGPEGLNKESTNQNQNTFATGQKRQKWKYHEFESTLLEWLTFLAEHNVQVVKQEDLRIDKPNAEQGTSMRVYHGRWKEQPVVLKCPLKYDLQQIHKLAKNSNGGNENADKFTRILRDMMFEIQVMAHSPLNKHPNIIKLLAISFEDFITPVKHSSGGDFIHEIEIFIPILVVEAAVPEYSTLDRFFIANNNKIDFDQARTLICDIACGLAAVHQYGVIHGDVKDQNILLVKELYDGQTRLVAKISDFGASGIESSREDIRGMSEYWAAPEVLERPQGWKGLRQTSAADIYSFGLLAATIALGGRRLLNEVSESWSMKQNDKMKAYAKEKLQTFFRANLNLDDDATQVFLKQILDICDKTLAQDTAKRLSDLSVVPQMFGLE
jgi:serine/threonine protein kinase